MGAVLGATVAHADDWQGGRENDFHGSAPAWGGRGDRGGHGWGRCRHRHHWGQGGPGHYQLQTVQVWVGPQQQQVWVPGRCHGHRHWRRCESGHYQTVWTPGHYEQRQEQVWVAGYSGSDTYGGGYGLHMSDGRGTFSVSIR